MTLRRLVPGPVAVILLAAGCTEPPALPVKTPAEAETMVQQLAGSVATVVGSPLTDQHSTSAPCADGGDDGGPWTLSGVADVAVAPDDQVATLTRLRDTWQTRGYEITEYHLVATGGSVSARVPADGLTVTVQSTGPRTGFAIIIATPCYRTD